MHCGFSGELIFRLVVGNRLVNTVRRGDSVGYVLRQVLRLRHVPVGNNMKNQVNCFYRLTCVVSVRNGVILSSFLWLIKVMRFCLVS